MPNIMLPHIYIYSAMILKQKNSYVRTAHYFIMNILPLGQLLFLTSLDPGTPVIKSSIVKSNILF